jgi:outer membrane protein OmpA-like peptidoglycan-associated protein
VAARDRARLGLLGRAAIRTTLQEKSMNTSHAPRSRAAVSIVAAALLAGALAGCENMSEREKGTAQGAGIGAVAGAALGAIVGDSKKSAATGAAIGAAAGAIGGNLWSKRMEDKKRAMEQSTQGTGVDVTRTADNQLKVNVPSDISFDTGRSAIKPELRNVLDSFANGLQNDPSMQVRIVGHTDSTGSDAINNPLSVDRANSVRDYLAGRGILASRIETSGRGSHEPIADNASDAGRAKNRRVEIFLREPQQAAAAPAQPAPQRY